MLNEAGSAPTGNQTTMSRRGRATRVVCSTSSPGAAWRDKGEREGVGDGEGWVSLGNLLHLSATSSSVAFPQQPVLRVDFRFCFRFTYQNN